MANPSDPASLCFGPFVLDLAGTRLLHEGAPRELPPRAFDLLRHLAERPGRLVTKDELLDEVWGRRFITEGVIKTAVSELRSALDDDAQAPRYIETVPRRGYRFVADVRPVETATAASAIPTSPAPPAAPRLPQPATPLLGREAEQALLAGLLGQHGLVTLLGPGGVGKTRLALAVAGAVPPPVAGSVWLVELSTVAAGEDTPALLRAALAQALWLGPNAARDEAALGAALRNAQGLVLLDNAEHVVDALAALLDTLLPLAPGLRWLVTSQEPLQLPGEQRLRLEPLPLPADTEEADAARLLDSAALRLFVDRVASRLPGFTLAPAQQQAVHDICRRLDGLPLALELAAARVPLFGVHGLLERLQADDDTAPAPLLDLLGSGPGSRSRSTPARQHTLRDALLWSHGLMCQVEQRVFRRLGVLRGSFTLDVAQAVAASEGEPPVATLDTLAALVDKSLLVTVPGLDPPRLRLLDAPRSLALEKLAEAGELAAWRRRHAQVMQQRAQVLARQQIGRPTIAFQDEAALELPDLRSALAWLRQQPDEAELRRLRLALIAWSLTLWHAGGGAVEGARLVDEATPLLDDTVPEPLRARFHQSVAQLALATVLPAPQGLASAEQAVALWRGLGDRDAEYLSLGCLVPLVYWTGQKDFDEAGALARMHTLQDLNDPMRGRSLRMLLGTKPLRQGDIAGYRDAMRRELVLMRRHGDLRNAWLSANNLGLALLLLEETDEAVAVMAEAVAEVRASGRTQQGWQTLAMHAITLLMAGRRDEALPAHRESLRMQWDAGVRWWGMEHWSSVLLLRGDDEGAAHVHGWTAVMIERLRSVRGPLSTRVRARTQERLEARFDAVTLERLLAEGQVMADEAVLALVLGED